MRSASARSRSRSSTTTSSPRWSTSPASTCTGSSPGTTARPREAPLVEDLIEKGATDPHPVPEHTTRPVILTSGTTGTPKGAPARGVRHRRRRRPALEDAAEDGRHYLIAAPLFHTWGWAHLNIAMLLGSKMVLRRKFDPADCPRDRREVQVRLDDRDPGDDAADPEALRGRALRRLLLPASRGRLRARRCPATSPPSGWTPSGRTSTTPTARPRSRGRRSPSPRTCARPRARPARRRTTPRSGSTTRTATASRPASPAASSSATRCSSAVTPVTRTRPRT